MKELFSSKKIRIIAILLVVGLVVVAGIFFFKGRATKASSQAELGQSTAVASLRDIQVTITGSGAVEPVSMYDIKPFVQGTILEAPYNVGIGVKEGDLLFRIDDSEILNQIAKSKINIEKTALSHESTYDDINNLTITAPIEGRIEDFTLKAGEDINGSNSVIAKIINDKKLTAQIPFSSSEIHKAWVGQQAQVLVSEYMSYVDGKVTYVSNGSNTASEGAFQYYVEISFDNPGIITEGMKVIGILKAADEDIMSSQEGTAQYVQSRLLVAKSSGTVKDVYVKNNDWVSLGQKIAQLENSDLENSGARNELTMKELELSLESQMKDLEDYNITSPIDGTVIVKNYKVGDDVNSSNTVLMTVADMTKMIFEVDVDELDIYKIKAGQKVNITCDALPKESFSGEVTTVPVLGTSQNGVTTYPVEVTISEPGNLKPGMNINAEIIVENKENVLTIPMAAITNMGDRTFVYVKADEQDASKENSVMPQEQAGTNPNQQKQRNSERFAQGSGAQMGQQPSIQLEDGNYQMRMIEVGINDNDYIEVISGLKEGDIVVLPSIANSNTNANNNGFGVPGMGSMGNPSGGTRIKNLNGR